jgi:hypothetical protein
MYGAGAASVIRSIFPGRNGLDVVVQSPGCVPFALPAEGTQRAPLDDLMRPYRGTLRVPGSAISAAPGEASRRSQASLR